MRASIEPPDVTRSARTRRMLAELPHEPANPVGAVIRAAAGLALLTLLVTSGTGEADHRAWADAGAYAAGTTSTAGEGARVDEVARW